MTELASLVAEVADDECAAAVLDHMVKTHGRSGWTFEKFSRRSRCTAGGHGLARGPDSAYT